MRVRDQEVGSVREDGKEEALCDAMVEERSDPRARGEESFNKGETGLSQRDSVGKVMLGIQCRGEPVAISKSSPFPPIPHEACEG